MAMTCSRCAQEIDSGSAFCRYCGAPVGAGAAPPRRLTRLPNDGNIAGVCAGLAAYLGVDATLIRLAWIILSIVPGGIVGGVAVYVIAWAVVPASPESYEITAGRRLRRSASDAYVGGVCGGLAEYFHADPTIVRLLWAVLTIIPGAIVLGVVVYLLAWAIMPPAVTPPIPQTQSSGTL